MKCKCQICDWEWISRVETPKQCPNCKRYKWNIKKNDIKLEGGEKK